jgi:glucokinase
MILAGDIGGTKTLVGLFDHTPTRPQPVAVQSFTTLDYPDLPAILRAFSIGDHAKHGAIESACFGVAGPVLNGSARLTNVPWHVDAQRVAEGFGIGQVALLNDLHATAYAVPVLKESELHVLQEGEALRGGNMALIAAGTGLGEALLHNIEGRFVPSPTEGGHADWAARTTRDITVLQDLVKRYGRAEVESVVSGSGLVNLHRITHTGPCPAVGNDGEPAAASAVSAAAMDRRCLECVEALSIFVDAYGAEAGNLALRAMATGGVFVGGGIAPKILPALDDGRFMHAFRDKSPFDGLMARMPVKVILNEEAGLLGAAIYAERRGKNRSLPATVE